MNRSSHGFIIESSSKIKQTEDYTVQHSEISKTKNRFLSRLGPEFRTFMNPKYIPNEQNEKPSFMYDNICIPYQQLPWEWYSTVGQHTTGWTAREKQSLVICNYYYFSLDVVFTCTQSKVRIDFKDHSKLIDITQTPLVDGICLLLHCVTHDFQHDTLFVTPKRVDKIDSFVFVDSINNHLYTSDGNFFAHFDEIVPKLSFDKPSFSILY